MLRVSHSCWRMQHNHRRDDPSSFPRRESEINENMSSPNMGTAGVKRWESTLRREREKSFVRHTHSLSDELSRTRRAQWRKRHFARCCYCALSHWQYGIRIRPGMKTHRTHPSVHPYAVSSPRKRCLHSIPKEMCSRKTRKGRNIWQTIWGQIRTLKREGNRAQAKVLFGQIEQHRRLYPFHITAIVINLSPADSFRQS